MIFVIRTICSSGVIIISSGLIALASGIIKSLLPQSNHSSNWSPQSHYHDIPATPTPSIPVAQMADSRRNPNIQLGAPYTPTPIVLPLPIPVGGYTVAGRVPPCPNPDWSMPSQVHNTSTRLWQAPHRQGSGVTDRFFDSFHNQLSSQQHRHTATQVTSRIETAAASAGARSSSVREDFLSGFQRSAR